MARAIPRLAGITCNAATLRDALHGYLRYRELIGNVDWLFAHETGDAIALEYVNEGDGRPASSAFANFAILVALARLYDPHVRIDEAAFAGGAFAPTAALRDLLGATVSFDAACNRVVLRSARFDTPFECYNAPLADIQRQAADAARERARPLDVRRVGRAMRARLAAHVRHADGARLRALRDVALDTAQAAASRSGRVSCARRAGAAR